MMNDGEENPPTELTTYIDPFESGKADSNERQAMMIAKRDTGYDSRSRN